MNSHRQVAIVCDWLTGIGGAERVVLELHRMFPDAPIYTSQYDPVALPWFKDADVRTTWLQKLPKSLRKFLPILRARSFSRLDLSNYDLVISSSGAEAKAVKTGPDTVHVCYCHAPTHYYWARYEAYLQEPGFGWLNPLARFGLKIFVGPMRKWDRRAAKRPDYLIANSTYTQKMIKKYYQREAHVIFPPVDTNRFQLSNQPRRGFVAAGRQVPYKRLDLAVTACTQLDLPLTVIGNGPEHKALRGLAGSSITFVTQASDKEISGYFSRAQAFIFPGVDDFGIVSVEAMAAGTPVIAYKGGGALDYLLPGETGEFFDTASVESLKTVLKGFTSDAYTPSRIAKHAQQFSTSAFHAKIDKYLQDIIQTHA